MAIDHDAICKQKKLRLYNGGGLNLYEHEHSYVCAKSAKHAVELINSYGFHLTLGYFREYWSFGSWGGTMSEIEPDLGVWVQMKGTREIVRLKPPEANP